MVSPDMAGLAQPWEWEGFWTSPWVLNKEIRQKAQFVSGTGAPMISLLHPSSYLSVCFHVEAQGVYSRAEPLFHDMDIAAQLWFGQVFPPVSSTDIPAGIIGSKGQCIAFFYKTENIFRINRGNRDSVTFWKRVQLTPLSLGLTHATRTLGKSH